MAANDDSINVVNAVYVASDSEDSGEGDEVSDVRMDVEIECTKNDEVGGDCNQRKKGYTELTPEDIFKFRFDNEQEACEFYKRYAKSRGFVMRKDDRRKGRNGNFTMRQLVCNREGARERKYLLQANRVREHKPLTRTGCLAKIRMTEDPVTLKWKVIQFFDEHNHALTDPEFINCHPAHRQITEVEQAQIETLHQHGVSTCNIMGLMAGQQGGYSKLRFCRKDVYNHIDKRKRAMLVDGDAYGVITYLLAKSDIDPLSYATVTTDDEGKLRNIFWTDGTSVLDYGRFGDMLAFDATYKINKYNKPLVIFSGLNHHRQMVIFGAALIADEKVETYKWVLEMLMKAMGNKHPITVMTDGDKAMKKAVKQIFPNATHRLCGWHLNKNACENVKNPKFLRYFYRAVYARFSIKEFEEFWLRIVTEHRLGENKWINETYKMRESWSAAYLKDKFFAGLRTTSICESVNAFVKRFVRRSSGLVEFMHNYERALKECRNNEMYSEFKSRCNDAVVGDTLQVLQLEASKLFTRDVFYIVKKEIEAIGSLNVTERKNNSGVVTFRVNEYECEEYDNMVTFTQEDGKFECQCLLFESEGIPCSHIFACIRLEHVTQFRRI